MARFQAVRLAPARRLTTCGRDMTDLTPAQKLAEKHNAGVKAGVGHNSGGSVESYADRLEKLFDEQKAIADDVRELKTEAKKNGVNPRALTVAVKIKMEDADKRAKRAALEADVDQYRSLLKLLD